MNNVEIYPQRNTRRTHGFVVHRTFYCWQFARPGRGHHCATRNAWRALVGVSVLRTDKCSDESSHTGSKHTQGGVLLFFKHRNDTVNTHIWVCLRSTEPSTAGYQQGPAEHTNVPREHILWGSLRCVVMCALNDRTHAHASIKAGRAFRLEKCRCVRTQAEHTHVPNRSVDFFVLVFFARLFAQASCFSQAKSAWKRCCNSTTSPTTSHATCETTNAHT